MASAYRRKLKRLRHRERGRAKAANALIVVKAFDKHLDELFAPTKNPLLVGLRSATK